MQIPSNISSRLRKQFNLLCTTIIVTLFLVGCHSANNVLVPTESKITFIAASSSSEKQQGLHTIDFDPDTLEFSESVKAFTLDKPLFGVIDKENSVAYFSGFHEDGQGHVTAMSVSSLPSDSEGDNSGVLTLLNSYDSLGGVACYVSLSPNKQFLSVANYMDETVSIFKVNPNGELNTPARVLTHHGASINKKRQKQGHPHWSAWDPTGEYLYTVNLGLDAVIAYPFDQVTGEVGAKITALKLSPGSGPRHLYFHPNKPWVYVINELANTISVTKRGLDASLILIDTVPLLDKNNVGENTASHIEINKLGTRLYAANRGENTLVVFEIGTDGELKLLQRIASAGNWPRHFRLFETQRLLFSANEKSGTINAFSINDNGMLTLLPTSFSLPSVVYISEDIEN